LLESSVVLVRGPELERDPAVLDRALQSLSSLPQLYLHVDIDVLDPVEAPGVDYPAAGGLSVATLAHIVQRTVGLGNIAALAITAVNPEKDMDERTVIAALAVIEAALARSASDQ
jgi:arginase family enzyme